MTVCVTPLYFCNLRANLFVLSKSAGFCRYFGVSGPKASAEDEKRCMGELLIQIFITLTLF